MTPPPSGDEPPQRFPEWLIGLVIAIVIVILGALLVTYLGAGDDPTFTESLGRVLSE